MGPPGYTVAAWHDCAHCRYLPKGVTVRMPHAAPDSRSAWCDRGMKLPVTHCALFEREPGSDDDLSGLMARRRRRGRLLLL